MKKHIPWLVLILILAIIGTIFFVYIKYYDYIPFWAVIVLGIIAILGDFLTCFFYKIALFLNIVNALFTRTNDLTAEDNEPSTFFVYVTRIAGIICIAIFIIPLITG